ncbi:MAG: hypothetical protein WC337_09415 [Candidatus Muiribacteriota bacterium]
MKKLTILMLVLGLIFSFSGQSTVYLTEAEMEAVTGKGGKGGGGGGGSVYQPPVDPDGLTSWEFNNKFVEDSLYYWNGVDYSMFADGYSDTDYDGQVDANDSVVIVETLKNMGYDVPATTIDGLYYNYYTQAGYDTLSEDFYTKNDFRYTKSNLVDEEDLKDGNFWKLSKGDLIFIDYDNDFSWNNAAVYMGSYGGYSHAALIASDYYDRVLVVDLVWDNVINLDLAYGYSDSKSLDYYNIERYF